MYIINDTYFQSLEREVPNLDEADSKAYAELNMLIDNKCRLFMYSFLTDAEVEDFNSYLVDGMFPYDVTGIPQKWIDLVNGKGNWKGLRYSLGSSKQSLLANYTYYYYLVNTASYSTGVGEARADVKGANSVNPYQKAVTVWNEFVIEYQSLINFIVSEPDNYTETCFKQYQFKNQLGL